MQRGDFRNDDTSFYGTGEMMPEEYYNEAHEDMMPEDSTEDSYEHDEYELYDYETTGGWFMEE